MKQLITTYEAWEKYRISTRTVRQAISSGYVKGRLAKISKSRAIYLIEQSSLVAYLKNRPKRGRPAKKQG